MGVRTTSTPICHESIWLQNSTDSMKIAQISHLLAQEELEQQAHMLVLQELNFQNSKDSSKIAQQSHLVAQGSYNNKHTCLPCKRSVFRTARIPRKSLKNLM